ncbi:MAG: C4-type zinc ribbon domain-containing protein [Elusimicrobia bacterium]|nr:C4-type zinc ribbon domain-containing protein [Elusimicrobiota bacterium]
METVHSGSARALVELQKRDTAIAALKARIAGVPVRLKAVNDAFEAKKAAMSAARETLMALQSRKKDSELRIAEAEEGIRKHQRELNMVKDNDAFKALLKEIDNDKAAKDELETGVLELLEEIDKASVKDKAEQAEVAVVAAQRDKEAAALEAEGREAAGMLSEAEAGRAGVAAGIEADLLERYDALRASRANLAVAEVHADQATGKLSCGGCHMGLTPQKALDVKKHDTFAVCPECRRWMYLEATIKG